MEFTLALEFTFSSQQQYLFENQSKYKRMYHDNSGITLTHPFVLYFFILLNDSYGFRIHAHHTYVLPHGCAHGENTSHPNYNQAYH